MNSFPASNRLLPTGFDDLLRATAARLGPAWAFQDGDVRLKPHSSPVHNWALLNSSHYIYLAYLPKATHENRLYGSRPNRERNTCTTRKKAR